MGWQHISKNVVLCLFSHPTACKYDQRTRSEQRKRYHVTRVVPVIVLKVARRPARGGRRTSCVVAANMVDGVGRDGGHSKGEDCGGSEEHCGEGVWMALL